MLHKYQHYCWNPLKISNCEKEHNIIHMCETYTLTSTMHNTLLYTPHKHTNPTYQCMYDMREKKFNRSVMYVILLIFTWWIVNAYHEHTGRKRKRRSSFPHIMELEFRFRLESFRIANKIWHKLTTTITYNMYSYIHQHFPFAPPNNS